MAGRTSSGRLGSGDIARKNSGSWFKKAFSSSNSKKPLDGSVTAAEVANSNNYTSYQQPQSVASEAPVDKSFGAAKVRRLACKVSSPTLLLHLSERLPGGCFAGIVAPRSLTALQVPS